jgi:two-component system response regulator HydG
MPRVLVVDDDAAVRRSIEARLCGAGYSVQTAESGEQGVEMGLTGAFDVVLTDLKMPGLSGIELLQKLRDRRIDSAFIVMTAFATVDVAVEAMKRGAVDFVQKPFLRDELFARLRAATERRRLERQVRLLERHAQARGSLDAIVGASEAIGRVRAFVSRAAQASGTVLVTGETGTGKELVARAIHAEGPRSERPLVPVNCAALTESVLESELFGHTRGAFTGATEARAGLVEHAHTGTLFLDEIGTMPKVLQAKLLRVLEAGEIRRVGENQQRMVDVRFVAATNLDLAKAVAAGEFRQDLFYRLNVLHVHLPALRERPGDIPILIEHFLERYGRQWGVNGVTEAAHAALLRYPYPGNVRQLEHIVQRAVTVAQGPHIDEADLPEDLVLPAAAAGVAGARGRAEREELLNAIERHRGELSEVARDLGVSRTTLWRMIRRHGLGDAAIRPTPRFQS